MNLRRQLLRVPSFGAGLSCSLVLLAAATAYMVFCPPRPIGWTPGAFLKLEPFMLLWDPPWWTHYRPRLAVEAALAMVGIALGMIVVYRLFRGRPEGRSLRAWLLAIALAGVWIAVIKQRHEIFLAADKWRVERALPGIKGDAEILLKQWPPPQHGVLPSCGTYTIYGDSQRPALTLSFMTADRGSVAWISPTSDEGLQFFLIYHGWVLEYHPDGRGPSSDNAPYRGLKHTRFSELEPNWFLVEYAYRASS